MIILSEKKNTAGPRQTALLILNQYFKRKKPLKNIINRYFKNFTFSELDRRFIFNIVKGTVRYYLRIDFIISLFSDKKLKNIDFILLNILRMGIYQLMYLDRVPDYSTVNESVNLARRNSGIFSSKFVNAVMRRISSISNIEIFTDDKIGLLLKDEDEKISINYSYPVWLIKYWVDRYGRKKTILICRSLNETPVTYLRFNKSKITAQALFKIPGMEPIEPDAGKLPGLNAVSFNNPQDIPETDAYRKGFISVQDISSQIAVKYFLNPGRGERILDVCAAPGGKTAYIAELAGDKSEVVSVDISRKRLKMLNDNLKRLNIKNVRVLEADAAEPDFLHKIREMESRRDIKGGKKTASFNGYFDRILVDAPCSAFGTISKNPDVKYNKTINDVRRLSGISFKILKNCDRYLKTGGRLVFYTCTLSPIENQDVAAKFLSEFKDKYIIKKPEAFNKVLQFLNHKKDSDSIDKERFLEIMPYYFNSEAGFVCSFLKKS